MEGNGEKGEGRRKETGDESYTIEGGLESKMEKVKKKLKARSSIEVDLQFQLTGILKFTSNINALNIFSSYFPMEAAKKLFTKMPAMWAARHP